MTLSISDQPSQWHRITKRHSLLSDATIDPFPHRTHRTASLIDHHIVRDGPRDVQVVDDGRRNTTPYLPYPPPRPPPPVAAHSQYPYPESRYPGAGGHSELFHDSRKRSMQEMAGPDISEESSSPTSPGQVEGGNSFCLCQPEPKIPRPRNAFILYRQHQQAAVVRANPGLPNPAISKIIGEQWSRLPEAQKNEWKALAEEEKARHAQQYPDYRYQPRRNGRYSSQSSGSGPPSGGQVDGQGNCKKCGGKPMNPPTTPYNQYPPTPRGSTASVPRGSQSMVSPPQSGRASYGDRHWPLGPPRYDPRDPRSHDPRTRYPSMPDGLPDAPDLKRRRFDGSGIYIPTREWREAPYQYSPRGPGGGFFHGEIPPDAHRPSIGGGPRPSYAQPPTGQAPRLSLARPPPPIQQKRDPSLTLPPLTTPTTTQASSASSASSASALEAMIMTINVINKVKILAQISPHLAPLNSMSSPSQEVRGSVVAIEGMDPTTVFSMTNSLAEELERDGKFAVRIFAGPDPYALRDEHGRVNKRLSIAETLGVIGEWHKISEEMKCFISTRVSPTSESGMPAPQRTKSVAIAEEPPITDGRKIADGQVDHDPSTPKPHDQQNEQTTTSVLSPSTVAKTADIMLATPPTRRPTFGERTPTAAVFPNSTRRPSEDEAPYTRIPAAAMQIRPTTPPRSTRSSTSSAANNDGTTQALNPRQFDAAPPPRTDSTASQQPPPTPITTSGPPNLPSTPTTPTSSSNTFPKPTSVHNPPPSPGLSTGTPIPIALVPHYQLTTVDSAAITLPINDSYSPLAHWQWLATLWRGCVGPDVTVVIQGPTKGADAATSEGGKAEGVAAGAEWAGKDGKDGGGIVAAGEQGKDGSVGTAGPEQHGRQGSAGHASVGANPPNSGGSEKAPGSAGSGPAVSVATAAGGAVGEKHQQGVDVRLMECRAVVVRLNGFSGVAVNSAGVPSGNTEERQNAQFWETAKRRVGFEVGEFLRR